MHRDSPDGAPATAPAAAPLTLRSPLVAAVLLAAFLYPVVLCALLLPSPASDLREHIALGLDYRFEGFAAPPLQTWLAGLIALTGARDAWLYVVIAQALNGIGLVYLVLIARRAIGEDAVVPLALMLCGTVYFTAGVPTSALNADQIQVPLWAGLVFHGLMALRENRWRDWLLAGILLGISVLAKYVVVVLLLALAIALLLSPGDRRLFANPRLYVAGLISLPIIALHVVPEWRSGHAFHYAGEQLATWKTAAQRMDHLWNLVRSYAVYAAPVMVALGVLAGKQQLALRPRPLTAAQRLIVLTVVIYVALIVVLIVGFGLLYATRHTYPFIGLSLVALLALIRIRPRGVHVLARLLLAVWAMVSIGTLVYWQVATHSLLQEPGPAAAAILRQGWDQRFRCGPAYVIGTDTTARLIAINFGRPVHGRAMHDLPRTDWVDKTMLAALGAIVVTARSDFHRPAVDALLNEHAPQTMRLPLRRAAKHAELTYSYAFIPPQACPPAVDRRP